MAEVKYAIFIEPTGELLQLISDWKESVLKEYKSAPYLAHPPHATLIFTHLKSHDEAFEALQTVGEKLEPISISCQSTIVFENDSLAGGGHTLAIKINDEDSLFKLQKQLAEAIVPIIQHDCDILPEVLNHGEFAESFKKYSFPFVGKHWIPHMSIASLKLDKEHEFIKKFEQQKLDLHQVVNQVSLWSVQSDDHQKLANFKLGA